jgi:hypothetical protein
MARCGYSSGLVPASASALANQPLDLRDPGVLQYEAGPLIQADRPGR